MSWILLLLLLSSFSDEKTEALGGRITRSKLQPKEMVKLGFKRQSGGSEDKYFPI